MEEYNTAHSKARFKNHLGQSVVIRNPFKVDECRFKITESST
jgi:hypothetical protein